jgi:hypothetical protein
MSSQSSETKIDGLTSSPEMGFLVSTTVQQKAKEKEIVVGVFPQHALLISVHDIIMTRNNNTLEIQLTSQSD